MFSEEKNAAPSAVFKVLWLIIAVFATMQLVYIILCLSLGSQIQQAMDEEQRVLIRTVFYVIAIGTFPLTSLLRHIFVRLNQTMPGEKTAAKRYLVTVFVSQAMMESVGSLGFVMFILGDDFNTLYIFSTLAVLGFFLQRPKLDEYQSIVDALEKKPVTSNS